MIDAREPIDELWVCHLGLVPYSDGLAIQRTLQTRRHAGEIPDTLLLLEHPAVYTRGRRAEAGELPFSEDFYRAKGIDVIDTDRGGRITYHGPGQLVGYPIMAVTDVLAYVRTMEQAIVAALAHEHIAARARPQDGPDYTGVWVDDRKIASIGVHIAHGISTHGFAVNVVNDLQPFSWVIACGLPHVSMTSIAYESTQGCPRTSEPSPACFRKRVAHSFCQAHGRRQRLLTPRRLGLDTTNAERRAPSRAPINPNPSAVPDPRPPLHALPA